MRPKSDFRSPCAIFTGDCLSQYCCNIIYLLKSNLYRYDKRYSVLPFHDGFLWKKGKGTKNKRNAAVTLACGILLHLAQLHKYNVRITFYILSTVHITFVDEQFIKHLMFSTCFSSCINVKTARLSCLRYENEHNCASQWSVVHA